MDYIPEDCCTMHKIIKLYNIFTLCTQSKLNKTILNLYQNDLIGYIPDVIKIWQLRLCWIGNWPIPMFVILYLEYSMHVFSKWSENETLLKSLFMYIYKCAIYIKDINWSLNLSVNIRGFYITESNWLILLLVSQIDSSLGTSNGLTYWANRTYLSPRSRRHEAVKKPDLTPTITVTDPLTLCAEWPKPHTYNNWCTAPGRRVTQTSHRQ